MEEVSCLECLPSSNSSLLQDLSHHSPYLGLLGSTQLLPRPRRSLVLQWKRLGQSPRCIRDHPPRPTRLQVLQWTRPAQSLRLALPNDYLNFPNGFVLELSTERCLRLAESNCSDGLMLVIVVSVVVAAAEPFGPIAVVVASSWTASSSSVAVAGGMLVVSAKGDRSEAHCLFSWIARLRVSRETALWRVRSKKSVALVLVPRATAFLLEQLVAWAKRTKTAVGSHGWPLIERLPLPWIGQHSYPTDFGPFGLASFHLLRSQPWRPCQVLSVPCWNVMNQR